MKKGTAIALALSCLLAAVVASAGQKKDKTYVDLKAVRADNVAPNQGHRTMAALGDRVHGGAFGPWRCQVKILDRRKEQAKMKKSGKAEGMSTSHFLSLSIMDPSTGKRFGSGKGTVAVVGPDKHKVLMDLQPFSESFATDVDLSKAGTYAFQIDFTSGKQNAVTKFSYEVK